MSSADVPSRSVTPDVRDIADSMLVLYGAHDDHDHRSATEDRGLYRPYSREPLFPVDPERYEAMRASTQRNADQYLHLGLAPVECRRCGAAVQVKKLAPGHTAVQWSTAAMEQCAHFAEQRAEGHDSSRTRSCPNMTASIRHAVAEGLLEEISSAPRPGDDLD